MLTSIHKILSPVIGLAIMLFCVPSKAHTPPKRVLIVGAGIAGLSAANYLQKQGYVPIVLEAQATIGGRIQTDRSVGFPFDRGASWIHGPIRNPISKLAKAAAAKTFTTQDENVKVYDVDGSIYSDAVLETAEERYDASLENLAGKAEQSFAEVFYRHHPDYKAHRLWTYMLSAFLEFDTGGDIDQLSSKDFYDDEAFKGQDILIKNGFDRITNYLAQDLDIRLNTQVTAIDYTDNGVSIATNKGSYQADMVLVTVPLGVLKKGRIQFTPALPSSTQQAIEQLEMGTVNKFLLIWEDAFWDKQVQYIGYTPEEKGKFNYFLNCKTFSSSNALMTFAFGNYAKTTEQLSDETIIAEIMQHLKAIYGKDIPKPKHLLRTQWHSNQYSFGAYSFVPKNARSNAFEVFETPIANKVFFAGEHTMRAYRGTVHGAYLSGIREAKKILKVK